MFNRILRRRKKTHILQVEGDPYVNIPSGVELRIVGNAGTSGQVLTSGGSGTNPSWGDPKFWSAIITQVQGEVSLTAKAHNYVDIQPPAGETWQIEISATCSVVALSYDHLVYYWDYDGTTRRLHTRAYYRYYSLSGYGYRGAHYQINRILTNTLYGSVDWWHEYAAVGYYAYSGFKLSEPLWSSKRLSNPESKPFKKPTDQKLPAIIEALDQYKAEILGLDPLKPNEYALGIVLEENTPLAVDPATGFPVERKSAYVKADILADFINKIKKGELSPAEIGYEKYISKWKAEGLI